MAVQIAVIIQNWIMMLIHLTSLNGKRWVSQARGGGVQAGTMECRWADRSSGWVRGGLGEPIEAEGGQEGDYRIQDPRLPGRKGRKSDLKPYLPVSLLSLCLGRW